MQKRTAVRVCLITLILAVDPALKAGEKTAHIPVIAVTVIRKINTLEYNEIIDSRIDEYVEKPLDYDGLLKVINKHLKRG